MFEKLTSWLKTDTSLPDQTEQRHELAEIVTGLLVEAGLAEGDLESHEQHLIAHVIAEQFDVPDADVDQILDKAISEADERIELHSLTSKLRAETDYEERVQILELVWIIVLADEVVDAIESQLMRRLSGLLYISDVDAGHAQKAARARLGIS